MPVTTCLAMAGALLLVAGGAAKTRRPATLVRAAASVGLPVTSGIVRGLAGLEVAIGLAAVAGAGRAAWAAVAASYVVLTGFVALVRVRRGALASCGCFGSRESPATVLHLVVTAACAVAAALAPGARAPLAAWVAAGAVGYLAYAVLTTRGAARA